MRRHACPQTFDRNMGYFDGCLVWRERPTNSAHLFLGHPPGRPPEKQRDRQADNYSHKTRLTNRVAAMRTPGDGSTRSWGPCKKKGGKESASWSLTSPGPFLLLYVSICGSSLLLPDSSKKQDNTDTELHVDRRIDGNGLTDHSRGWLSVTLIEIDRRSLAGEMI